MNRRKLKIRNRWRKLIISSWTRNDCQQIIKWEDHKIVISGTVVPTSWIEMIYIERVGFEKNNMGSADKRTDRFYDKSSCTPIYPHYAIFSSERYLKLGSRKVIFSRCDPINFQYPRMKMFRVFRSEFHPLSYGLSPFFPKWKWTLQDNISHFATERGK